MTIGERIKHRREELKLSQEELAHKLGYKSRSTINKIELGANNLTQSKIKAMADALEVTPAYLMGWEDSTSETSSLPSNITPIKTKKLPLIGSIACGVPILAEENIDRYIDVMDTIHADYCLECKGDSMIGARIHDGDLVCIRLQPQVENGQIAAVRIGDEATLKRVYLSKDQIILQAENPEYAPMVYTGSDLDEIEIIGKAVAFVSIIK